MSAVLDAGSLVLCPHGGHARPTGTNPRVRVSGVAVPTMADTYIIDGCRSDPLTGDIPCTTARFITGATRVRIGGVPVLLRESRAVCEPRGAFATVAVTRSRVTGV